MLRQILWPVKSLASWLGGWTRVLLLVLAVVGVAAGLIWERQRHPPLPPQAEQVSTSLISDIRQTTFRYPGSVAELRSFYRQALPQRGWRYCGTQATPGCTNMIRLVGSSDDEVDVYRRAEDQDLSGATIEIWPQSPPDEQTYVTVFQTRGS